MSDQLKDLEDLAETIAQARIDAAFDASCAINAALMDALVEKGVMSRADLEQVVRKLERAASDPMTPAMLSKEFILRAALMFKRGFDLDQHTTMN